MLGLLKVLHRAWRLISSKKGQGKKKTLTFEVKQEQDSAHIFEGQVQKDVKDAGNNNDKDRSFSLEDTDYIGLGLTMKNLANDRFIPLMGFQSNSAFNSLRNSPVTRKDPLLSDKPWRKSGPTGDMNSDTEPLAYPNMIEPTTCMHMDTGLLTQLKLAVPPVTVDEWALKPSMAGVTNLIVVSSNDDENDSEGMLVRRQVRKLLNDETQVRSEVLTDLRVMTPTEITIVKAFTYSQTTKAFEQLEYNANLTTILIGRSFMAPDKAKVTKSTLRTDSFSEQKAALQRCIEKGKRKPTIQIRDEMKPTVSDQGIIFNKNNNPWLKPDFAEGDTQPRQGNMGHKVLTTQGDGPLDDGDSLDDEGDNDQGNGKRDPFMPKPWPRATSTAPSSQSVEAKI
ncbi:hypothetical protein F5146DRAFT_1005545 [Armillaria mellea]|nr:hypothetical protein F5146DRAFT_1005545 [Armillaria mellea]